MTLKTVQVTLLRDDGTGSTRTYAGVRVSGLWHIITSFAKEVGIRYDELSQLCVTVVDYMP